MELKKGFVCTCDDIAVCDDSPRLKDTHIIIDLIYQYRIVYTQQYG